MGFHKSLIAAGLAGALAFSLSLPNAAAASSASASDLLKTPVPYTGVYVPDVKTQLRGFVSKVGVRPNLIMFFKSWAKQRNFDPYQYDMVHAMGATPIIAWEPWNPSSNPVKQPSFRLKQIINGRYDSLIHNWASGLAKLNYPVMIRFAHEMNGHWYPWAFESNGNKPGDYVKAWRHVHDIFTSEGANNVAWVWSPNVNRFLKGVSLRSLYPGDNYVDIVGMVGFGTQKRETFSTVFASTIAEVRKFTKKKFLITETGAQELNINKAAWTKDFFARLTKRSDFLGYVWFNEKKRADWRVTTSKSALDAFKTGVRTYVRGWKPSSK